MPESWSHKVTGDGSDSNMNFHYTWMDIEVAQQSLSGQMGLSMDLLVFFLKMGPAT